MKKRIISCLLCLCMVIGLFSAVPFAQAQTFSGTVNPDVSWSFDSETGTLTFSGSGTAISGSWNNYRSQVKKIVLEEGITAIGDNAFPGIASLTEIVFPATLTTIGSSAFAGCSGLTAVEIPDSVTTLGASVFSGCSNLVSASLGDGLTAMGTAVFSSCAMLEVVTVGDGLTALPTAAFSNCSSLKKVTLGAGIAAIGDSAFASCAALEELVIEGTVSTIGASAFAGCSSLTDAPIYEGLVSIGKQAFSGCTGLFGVILPTTITDIAPMAFQGCTGLVYIDIDEENRYFCTDETGALYDKEKTSLLAFPLRFEGSYALPESVKSLDANIFAGCEGLTGITLPKGLESVGDSAFSGCINLTEVVVPEGTTSIGSNAFAGCIKLRTVSLPNSITSMGTGVFAKCGRLTSVNIPEGMTAVRNSTFSNCTSLTEIVIPEGVKQLEGSAFIGCSKLTSVALPESLTSIGAAAFANCSALTALHIPKKVTSISSAAFDGCSSLAAFTVAAENASYSAADGILFSKDMTTLLRCPSAKSGVYTVPESVKTLEHSSFEGCNSLTSVILPEGLETVKQEVFYKCLSLESISIPNSVTTLGEYAFEYCPSLQEVKLGNGITTITRGCFRGCTKLTAITLPASITKVVSYGLNDCNALDHVLFKGTQAQWQAVKIESVNSGLSDVTVHCEASGNELSWGVADGRDQLHCTLCERVVETPCNHVGTTVIVPGTEPTCTENGLTESRTCTLCNEVIAAQEEIPALNHPFYTEIYVAATCEEDGYYSYTCDDCGETFFEEVLSANGHAVVSIDNEDGTHYSHCCICLEVLGENIPHTYVDGVCECGAKYVAPYLDWSFDSETGTLTFTGNIAIPSSGQWNMYRNKIKSVVIEDGITAISDGALSGISTLTSVSIPSTVKTIGNSAFSGCTNLTSATIPDGVESIGNSLFSGCSNLQEVIVGDGVTAVGSQVFSGCSKLTDVTLGESITSIGYSAFGGCSKLTNLNIEGNITSIGDSAFGGCSKLTDISLGAGQITIGNSAFSGCAELTNLNTEGSIIAVGDYAFSGCAKLTNVPLGEGLISIGNSAFGGCAGLTSMRIPASVESIGTFAFSGCTNIPAYEVDSDNTHYSSDEFGVLFNIDKTTLILCPTPFTGSYEVPASVKTIEENAFNGCTGLTAVKLNKGLETIGSYAFQYCGLTEVEVPDGVVSLGSYVFAYNDSLQSAELPDGITTMGTGNFYCCGKLEKANIPAGVTNVRMATFTDCYSLTEVHIAEGVKAFETSAFSGCSSLENITLPESTTTIGGTVFAGCSALESIHLPKNVSSVTASAFNGCKSLTEFTVDGENASYTAEDGILFNKNMSTLVLYPRGKAGAYEVPAGVTAIGADAFRDCGKLTEITLPEGLLSIGEDGFYKCVLLERVNIPDSVTSMPAYTFEYCTALLEVKVGSGITAINRATFRGCEKLTAITLPAGIATIDQYAFNECGNLDHILFEGTEEQWNAINVGKNNSGLEAATVHFEATGNEVYWDEAEGRQQLHCSLCEIVIETPCNHFNVTVLSATEPTCTEVGLTEGKLCADCGEVLLAQEEIPASGHSYEAEVTVPTCTEDGTVTVACTACGEVLFTGGVPALGHSFEYINEGDSHRVVCRNRCDATDEHGTSCENGCDYAVTEAHSFTDGICVCGAVEITEPVLDSSLTFGAQLYLENDLTMAFRVKTDKLTAYDISTAYLLVERDVYATGAEEAAVEAMTISEYKIENGRLIFSYPGIAAAQMNDAIRATLYIKDASGKEYVSPVLHTSVATYLDGLLTNSASDSKLITLLIDMVNYGAAAQIYFDRHADAPVNEAFESFKTYANYASADFKTALENLSATENAEGKSGKLNLGLDLGTRIGIQYKVTVPADVNVEDVTLVVTDTNGNVLETLAVAGNETDSRGRYLVNFYGFTSRDMRRVVYATAYANGEAITGTYAYSISTYAWGVQENAAVQPENLVNVTRAMMLYGDSAAAYFA